MQERQAALAAVSSQLWQGRNSAAANSPHSTGAVSNSPTPANTAISSKFLPSANTLTAASVCVVPTVHGAVTQSVSDSEKLANEGQDKASKHQRMQAQAVGVGKEFALVGNSSGQGLSDEQQGLSERQARAAARLSRLAKNTTTADGCSPEGQNAPQAQDKASTGTLLGSSFHCLNRSGLRDTNSCLLP